MQDTKVGKSFSFKEFILPTLACALFATAGIIHQQNPKPEMVLTKQDTAININKDVIIFFNVGNKRLFSDLLWIQTLLESDVDHYKNNDLNSWMYLRFLNISVLDPLFYENYVYGGLYLSIVKDDVLGAAEIFERGLIHYPDDYKLNYYAGFNYYFEQGKFEKGLKYMEKIKDYPQAPAFIVQIVSKLKFEMTKDYDIALVFLKHQYGEAKDDMIKQKLTADIYAVQAERDLECLNAGKKDCHMADAEGRPYLQKGTTWVAAKPFNGYRIYRHKK